MVNAGHNASCKLTSTTVEYIGYLVLINNGINALAAYSVDKAVSDIESARGKPL